MSDVEPFIFWETLMVTHGWLLVVAGAYLVLTVLGVVWLVVTAGNIRREEQAREASAATEAMESMPAAEAETAELNTLWNMHFREELRHNLPEAAS